MISDINKRTLNVGDETIMAKNNQLLQVKITEIKDTTLHYIRLGNTGIYDGKVGWCYRCSYREIQDYMYKL